MIKVLLFDFSRVLLFPKDDTYEGKLNDLYKQVRNLPDFNFFDHFRLNNELVEYLKVQKKNFRLVMFTSEIIQNDPAVKNILENLFEKVFSATEMGFDKSDVNSYLYIIENLGCKPEEVLFIDDWEKNIETAKKTGLNTHLFINTSKLIKFLESMKYI